MFHSFLDQFLRDISKLVTNYEWEPLNNKNQLKGNAKTFGKKFYVGGGSYNGYSGPARIDAKGQCTVFMDGRTQKAYNCFFLKDIPQHFDWIDAYYGNKINGPVRFNNIKVGRIQSKTGEFYLGRIQNGFLYYDIGDKESKAGEYEALVFRPLRRA